MAPKKQVKGSRKKSTAASSTKSPSSSSCHPTSPSSTHNGSTPPKSTSASSPVSSSTGPPLTSLPSPRVPLAVSTPSIVTSTSVSTSTSSSASTTTDTPASSKTPASAPTTTTSATKSLSISASVPLADELLIKLDGKNYHDWSEEAERVLKAQKLLGFVVKSVVIPEQYASEIDRTQNIETEEYMRWFVQDQMLRTWLLSSMCEDVIPLMARCKYSWQVWNTAKEHFYSHLKAKIRRLRSELGRIKKGNESVSEYVGKIQNIVDSLAESGSPVSEEDHVEAVLGGLPGDYNSVVKMARMLDGLTPVAVCNIETWCLVLEEKYRSEYRYVDGGGGPSTQDDNEPSCSPECSTAESVHGRTRSKRHGRGGRRRGRN